MPEAEQRVTCPRCLERDFVLKKWKNVAHETLGPMHIRCGLCEYGEVDARKAIQYVLAVEAQRGTRTTCGLP